MWIILAGAASGSVLVYVVVGAVVINSVISVPYYFGIFSNMFFEKPADGAAREPEGAGGVKFSVYALAVLTVLFLVLVWPLSALVGTAGL